jgi:hypothetical protein
MFRFLLRASRQAFFCTLLLLFSHPIRAEPTPKELPLRCEIARGWWCILGNVGEINFSKTTDENIANWTFYDSYWKRKVGVLLEQGDCKASAADSIQILRARTHVLWKGHHWNDVTVGLKSDSSCKLRILVPAEDPSFLVKAATALSGNIAVCMANQLCSDNILSERIFDLLVKQ